MMEKMTNVFPISSFEKNSGPIYIIDDRCVQKYYRCHAMLSFDHIMHFQEKRSWYVAISPCIVIILTCISHIDINHAEQCYRRRPVYYGNIRDILLFRSLS